VLDENTNGLADMIDDDMDFWLNIVQTEFKPPSTTVEEATIASTTAEKCFIVQRHKKTQPRPSSKFIQDLLNLPIPEAKFEFQAALIVFTYPNSTQAMIFGLDSWVSLLNPDCIVPQWGLCSCIRTNL
jgi:hypothetical protein